MFHAKFRLFLTAVIVLFLFLFLASCGLYIFFDATHPVTLALFKTAYNVTPYKKSFLELYSPYRRDINARYLPPAVDEFLCRRIETTADDAEVSAIVNLYAIHAGGREGDRLFKVSEPVKEKIAAELVRQMDEDPNLWGQLILLEEIRLGKSLGKGYIDEKGAVPKPVSREEWNQWKEEKLPGVREKYKQWWNSGLSWEEKKKINPLEGAAIGIYDCCG